MVQREKRREVLLSISLGDQMELPVCRVVVDKRTIESRLQVFPTVAVREHGKEPELDSVDLEAVHW